MPNYIKNILKINAPPERVQELLSQIKSDTDPEQLLDFNKIIPMADSLKITAGSEEELCSLYMTYINPEVDYYGEGHKEENGNNATSRHLAEDKWQGFEHEAGTRLRIKTESEYGRHDSKTGDKSEHQV